MSIFNGLSAFPITPCDAGGTLIADDFRKFVSNIAACDVQSIGVLGSTGSYVYLNRETRADAVKVARNAAPDTPLIVGVGALRTDAAVDLAKDAAAAGADGLLLAPVSYAPLFDDEVYAHFEAVAAATDRPLCIYNNPGTTHFTFSTSLLQRIGALPTVQAVKMPLPADLGDVGTLRAALPKNVAIGYSADWGCADCILAGGEAWYSVIAGYLPRETALLARAAEQGNAAEVARLNAGFAPLWDLFQTWGSVRVVYTAAHLDGVTFGVLPKPLLPLPEQYHAQVKTALSAARAIAT